MKNQRMIYPLYDDCATKLTSKLDGNAITTHAKHLHFMIIRVCIQVTDVLAVDMMQTKRQRCFVVAYVIGAGVRKSQGNLPVFIW